VRRFPDRPAVSVRREDAVERFTYLQLDDLAVRAASCLVSAGVGAGDRCAILGENSASWVAVYLGALRIGAIAVPLDTSYKTAQVATLLRDCGARVILASERFEDVARAAGGSAGCRLLLISDVVAHAVAGPERQANNPWPSDPAVILYTSGTTADPKGVVLSHANLLAQKDSVFQALAVGEHDSILGVLPLFHALAQMANLLLPFSVGAQVVFIDTLNTRQLLQALDEENITIFVCVPQFFYLIHHRVMTETGKAGAAARFLFRRLLRLNGALRRAGINPGPWLFGRVHRALGRRMRLLITGGSKFDQAIGNDLYGLGFTILQAYGLTETSGAATLTRPGEPIQTVGRPLPGVAIRTLPAADNLDGEVVIRGPIVMSGYWNRPQATAEVLRDGWLHTGDLGRLDAEGRLTITGRSKEVIVLSSGKNIYPEEIEAHYRQSPFIRELCVLGIASADAPSAERLHALVVPDADVLRERKIVNTSELIRFELEGLSISLPAHKRVLGFDVSLQPLPRTTTRKLKRHEIAKRYRAGGPVAAPEPANTGPMDDHLARIVALVQADVRPGVLVRPDSNLELDLGFDSMERVELLASLEQRFGVRIPENIAQGAFLVRDIADAFRGATESATGEELQWDSMLELEDPGSELRALLKPRPLSALLVFAVARIVVRTLVRPSVRGLEHLPHGRPLIICPNHQSYIDPVVIVAMLPLDVFRQLFFVGAAEYFQTTVTAWLARKMNVVPVDPDANLLPAMQAGAFGLRHGKVLVLFPEGERSIDGTVRKFKKGAAILSQHLQVPIVPVAIHGVFELWPRNRPLDWRGLLPWSGHHVTIRFGPPLDPPPAGVSYADHTATLHTVIEGMWLDART
jgi:long-chain acyl-CoA synthetase